MEVADNPRFIRSEFTATKSSMGRFWLGSCRSTSRFALWAFENSYAFKIRRIR